MLYTASLPLTHSWPIFEADRRMDLGRLRAFAIGGPERDVLDEIGIGAWSCDLANDSLSWSPAVYRLFGFPQSDPLDRALTVSCYSDHSRPAMEALRAYAIRHRRGFTLDAMIRRPDGDMRWMRLSALPVIENGKVVRLCGTKQDVTVDYDGPG